MKNTVLFIYSSYENIGVEYLSASLKLKNYKTDMLFFPMIFNDGMLDIQFLAKFFDNRKKIIDDYDFSDVFLVCFSVTTDYFRYFLHTAEYLKKNHPDIPVIFGGIHPSSTPLNVLKHSFIDYVCVGEGDYVISEFADYLLKKNIQIPEGIWFKKNNKIIENGISKTECNLDRLPFPDKNIFYEKAPYLKNVYTIFTSRGCPYSCSYCFNNVWYKNLYSNLPVVRRRSVKNVIKELKSALDIYNYKYVMFEDDIFILSEKWHKDFVIEYKKHINRPFVCILHPKQCLKLELLIDLKNAGCFGIEIGIQTLNEKVRKKVLNRNETNSDIIKALSNLKKSKIPFNVDHIAGLYGDTFFYQLKSVKTYSRFRPNRLLLSFITNYPGTEIEKYSIEKNLISKSDVEKMHNGSGFSEEYTGSVTSKKIKKLEKLRFFFGWIPFLPHSFILWIIKTKLYRIIPSNRLINKIIPSILITAKGTEPRGKIILYKYFNEFKKYFKLTFLKN